MNKSALELYADRIEMVLHDNRAPACVTGGVVTPRAVQYHLAPAMGVKVSKVQALADELALALGVTNVRVSRQGSSVQLEVPRDDARPVKLLPLMAQLKELPAYTATLGMCDDGAPLLARLPSKEVGHVLISGVTGSGKTALCQAMILSLAMTHRRSQLQIAPFGDFGELKNMPHIIHKSLPEIARLIPRQSSDPRIVVVIDPLPTTLNRELHAALDLILKQGQDSGIHVITTAGTPAEFSSSLFPVRLVGKVPDADAARMAAGIGGTGAEKLAGRGDFLAVAAGQVVRFQAAYVSAAEMEQVVAQMGSAPSRWDVINGRPSLLREATALVASAK